MSKYFVFSLLALALLSCDVIAPEDALQTRPNNPQNPDPDTQKQRVVLVEDFTGHQCGNCPQAGKVAKELPQVFGNQVVVVAIHCGFFARTNSSGKYSTDFTSPHGNDIDAFFGASQAGLPKGMVNRMDFAGSKLLGHTSWAGKVQELLAEPMEASVVLSANFDATSREVAASASVTFLKSLSGDFGLVLALTEDGIVTWQKDYSLENQDIPDYTHNHVFRAVINGNWQGEDLTSNPLNGTTIKKQAKYTLSARWKEENIHLIGYIYDKSTQRVLQAASVKLIKL